MFAGLFTLALLLIAAVAQFAIVENAKQSIRRELVASSIVYDRIWSLKSRALSDSADLLARDFGFRAALASGDLPTVRSALDNLRERAGVSTAFIVTPDGSVIGIGGADFKQAISGAPYAFDSGRGSGVTSIDGRPYQLIVTPILAPVEIGWIVFAVHLDAAEMRALERLSAIPLSATIVHRQPGGAWADETAGPVDSAVLGGIAERALRVPVPVPEEVLIRADASIALAKPLPALGDAPRAILVLNYPLARALASFRPLQVGILLTGLFGLILVLLGSIRLARGIARPIAELDRAARALEAGGRSEVAIVGDDEVARLAISFNAMSRGIFERENRIAHMAFNDALTGLPNRVFFREQLDASLRRSAHQGAALAILCLDLDGFKAINDTLGHPFGDKVLVAVGAILTASAPNTCIARLGGDEFAIILPDGQESDAARNLARKLIERLQDPILIEGQQVLLGSSVGIAVAPADGDNADTLLKNADLALYRAKQDGRSVFRFFKPELDAEAQSRRQMEIDLREALAQGQFRLEFQPIFSSDAVRIVCFEALLRWEHPISGAIGPDRFIPVAEESGLILRIGEWVIQEACRQASAWRDDIRVAVNVSPLQFRNPGLNAIILQALSNSGIAPGRLEIEITESIFLESCTDTIEMLHSLRRLGVRIALDDFGTGYSSLSYLRRFPFDKIKIDKCFIDNVSTERGAAAIVKAIVDLASALGMETTAEGVENVDQLERLRAQGCGSIQGFLLGRPVSAGAATGLSDDMEAAQAA